MARSRLALRSLGMARERAAIPRLASVTLAVVACASVASVLGGLPRGGAPLPAIPPGSSS